MTAPMCSGVHSPAKTEHQIRYRELKTFGKIHCIEHSFARWTVPISILCSFDRLLGRILLFLVNLDEADLPRLVV